MKPKIGHYEIAQELGRGGMGVVYKGFEAALNRFVAIKTLSQSLAHDASIVERFMREARSMASLNDPHIIQIYFVGEDEGQPFFAMEFVEGESLSQKLKREGRLPASVACQILLQTAQGLTTAHDRGVIHRDIKPANLMITQRGLVKVADFGIALATRDFSNKLTSTGEFVGTPGYLSPEVCMGKNIDQRSDIFSLGIVLFEMLTGKIPFNDASPLGLMLEVVQADIPDVRTLNSEVDSNVHAILTRMVAKEPEHRYQSCHELIEDLVSIGTSTVSGLTPRPLSAHIVIPPAPGPASGRQAVSAVSGIGAAAGMPPAPAHPISSVPQRAGQSAATVVSSPGQAAPAPRVAAAPPQVPPPARAGGAAPAARSSSAAPWLIAAAVLLGGSGYAGWHFRAELGLVDKPAELATTTTTGETSVTGTSAGTSSSETASNGASTPAVGTGTATAQLSGASEQPSGSANPGEPDTAAPSGSSWFNGQAPATAESSPDTASPALTAGPDSAADAVDVKAALAEMKATQAQMEQTRLELQRMQEATSPDRVSAVEADEGEDSGNVLNGPGPRAGLGAKRNFDRLNERVAVRTTGRANAEAPTQASASPARVAAPRGRVLVVAFGHPGAAAVAQQTLASALGDEGFTVIEADGIGGLARLLDTDRDPDVPALARLAASHGIDVIVTARVQILGTQELTYYGQSSTQFNSMLGVRAFAVNGNSALGSWQERLDFTSLNVLDMTREAVQPNVSELARKLGPYRAKG